jgi:glycosyltransferase involved in cell wall biosynthesis
MKCPTQKELHIPPQDKTGWPWTEESSHLPDKMDDGSDWPRISIVTPSYNQGMYIEETIRSVLLQGYPNLEYIIIDGGSTDNTLDIIKKYEKWLAFWVSELDTGQSNAINKGIKQSSGKIIGWINSDDVYCQDAFKFVSEMMYSHKKIVTDVLYGNCIVIDENGIELSVTYGKPNTHDDIIKIWKGNYGVPQPGLFISGDLFRNTLLDENLHYVLDWELMVRISQKASLDYFNNNIAKFRHHNESKSISSWVSFIKEKIKVLESIYLEINKLYIIPLRILYYKWIISYYYHNYYRKKIKKVILRFCGGGNRYLC